MRLFRVLALVVLCATSPAVAQIVDFEISGSTASAQIELPGGIGADVSIVFEQVVGLTTASLGLSATLVDPADPALLSRLPDLSLVSVPAAFPVVVGIDPPATGPLSFTGVAQIELHTHNLNYTENSPLRLFAAPAGGAFEDITRWAGQGTYRVGGSKGGFSEFMIVADLRLLDDVVIDKYQRIQAVLDANDEVIPEALLDDLQSHLDSSWYWYRDGREREAVDELEAFDDLVKAYSGTDIPNVWRSSQDLDNVAGKLRAGASTLIYSLRLLSSVGS